MVEENKSNAKLDAIRGHMKTHDLDAFVCFHMDQHNSEYIAECDERIAFISGFKGSNGVCVITHNDARMWTDGRYYIAAVQQLQNGWKMEKMEANVKQWAEWTAEQFPDGATVGLDFTQYPAGSLEAKRKTLEDAKIQVKSVPNLVDLTWGADRPAMPANNVMHLPLEFTGEETLSKYERIAEKVGGKLDSLLVTTLDDIAWTLNFRGTDIDYNPVFFSYLMLN